MKRCSLCSKEKTLDQFGKGSRWKDGLRPECRACRRVQAAQYHADLTPEQWKRKQQKGLERKLAVQREVFAYLTNHSCTDCCETDPIVLEFDHVRGEKVVEVSRLICTRDKVFDEIAKCDVVCRNCHTRRTAKQFGWYQHLELVA